MDTKAIAMEDPLSTCSKVQDNQADFIGLNTDALPSWPLCGQRQTSRICNMQVLCKFCETNKTNTWCSNEFGAQHPGDL